MHPAQRNKVDISKLNPQEQQLFARYGKLPTHKNILMKMQKERKYFDSGDYALSKAGKADESTVGTAIPNPENIPHASTPTNGHGNSHPPLSISPTNSTSPILQKESGLATDENTTPPVYDQTERSSVPAEDGTRALGTVVSESTTITIETTNSETTETVTAIAETVTIPDTVVVNKSPA